MPNEDEKKYCVTIKADGVEILVILTMDEEHLNLVNLHKTISWVFNHGCQIIIDKNLLDDFSVEPMQ